jgi:hypothetical protein
MPTSNLVIDFYDTTMDDFIQTFLQQTWYKNYLMWRGKGHGPKNYELHLQVSNWSCYLQKMVETLSNIASSSSLQSKMVGLEGEKRFRTCKQNFGNPLGFARDSHWKDRCFMILHNMSFLHHFLNVILLQTWDPILINVQMWHSFLQAKGTRPSILHVHVETYYIQTRWQSWTHKTKF